MATILWDKVGEHFFQTAMDRGVLYPHGLSGIAWNGLNSVEDASSGENKSFFLDGVKYLEQITPSEYSGKLKAFTYPIELDPMLGLVDPVPGLVYHDQPPSSFNLSYRTRLGNDLEGTDLGYR